jgi:hypothetical protein
LKNPCLIIVATMPTGRQENLSIVVQYFMLEL